MAKEKKKCFVIMPITLGEHLKTIYGDDIDHFKHALECLIEPALKSLDYEVIPPKAKGADLIQAEIIENLVNADLVLCDMSRLNPNVFFELGIRTALNKPVCMIRDDKTSNIPFDIGIINFHTYNSRLPAWNLEEEIKELEKHIKESVKRSMGKNMMWKYFGITTTAKEFEQESGDESKLDFIITQVDALSRKLQQTTSDDKKDRSARNGKWVDEIYTELQDIYDGEPMPLVGIRFNDDDSATVLMQRGEVSSDKLRQIINLHHQLGLRVDVEEVEAEIVK